MSMSRIRKEQPSSPGLSSALDPFRDFEGSPFELWIAKLAFQIRSNILGVLSILGAIALVLGGIIGYTEWSKTRDEQNLRDFEKLLESPVMVPGAAEASAPLEKLDEFIKTHSSAEATTRAELKKIEILRFADEPEKAGEAAERISTEVNDPDLKAYFTIMAATYFENAAKNEKALGLFQKADNLVQEQTFLKALAIYGLGRNQILTEKTEEGRATIRKLLEMKGENLDQLKIDAIAYLIEKT